MQFEVNVEAITGKLYAVNWRIVGAVCGSSFVLAAALSVAAGYLLLPDEQSMRRPAKLADSGETAPSNNLSLNEDGVNAIVRRNIFNSAGVVASDEAQEEVGQQLVKSDLPIKLMGTIYGGTPFNGIAIIESTSNRNINSFMVGDTILNEGTVKEIQRERIIIERRGGQMEFVDVEKQELKRTQRQAKRTGAQPATGAFRPSGTGFVSGSPQESYSEEGFDRAGGKIEMSQQYREMLLGQNFAQVLQDAKASPNMVDGQLRGFVLSRIRQNSIYAKSGLTDGDIVEEINGVALTDAPTAIRYLNQLRNEASIEMRIRRGGQLLTFSINIR